MHLTLRITVNLLAAFGSISLASGCGTPTLQIEAPGDVSGYRTWDFVQPVPDAIRAPWIAGVDLEPVVAKQVERGLSDRGFQRTTSDPGLLVYFQLVVRRQLVEEYVTGAVQHVPSLHYSPSYDIQKTWTEVRRYEVAELMVLMLDPSDRRLVWRGRFEGRYRDEFTPHLGAAVSQLLARVPQPRPSSNGRTAIVKAAAPRDARSSRADASCTGARTQVAVWCRLAGRDNSRERRVVGTTVGERQRGALFRCAPPCESLKLLP